MSTEQAKNLQNTEAKKGLWADISSDQDEAGSQKQQSQDEQVESGNDKQKQSNNQNQNQEQNKKDKTQPKIKSFDPKKHLRGGFANMKTVKGGFKPQKLQKKKFHLDAVKNPFDLGDNESQEEQEQNQTKQNTQVNNKQEHKQQNKKLSKKEQQKKQRQELQAALKQFGVQSKNDAQGQKKKKKKKAKKPVQQTKEAQIQTKQHTNVVKQIQPIEDFQVDKQKLEEILKAKAKKVQPKKSAKTSVANAALRAKQQREAKNKQKKVYVDL